MKMNFVLKNKAASVARPPFLLLYEYAKTFKTYPLADGNLALYIFVPPAKVLSPLI